MGQVGHYQSQPGFSTEQNAQNGTEDRVAVAALVQLQGSTGLITGQPQDSFRRSESCQERNQAPDMAPFYNHTGLYHSRSDSKV